MVIEILEDSKGELKAKVENVTLAELLKVHLNQDSSVTFAAWKRQHPTEKPILVVRTKGKTPKKAIADAANSCLKELSKVEEDFKKLK